jgi:hypothetical protein
LAKRAPLYKYAMDFMVDTDHQQIDEICDAIVRRLIEIDNGGFK